MRAALRVSLRTFQADPSLTLGYSPEGCQGPLQGRAEGILSRSTMPRSTVVMTIPGVLQKLVTSAPIQEGILLYRGLTEVSSILLVTDDDKEKTDYWLKMENLTKHGDVLYGPDFPGENRRMDQVRRIRSRGFAVDMVVEPDPAICAALISDGFTTLNFIHRSYAFPSWRPDYEGTERSWDKIREQAEKDKLLRMTDARLETEY
jgi:hypothetical protein